MGFKLFDILLPRETKFYSYMNEQVDIFNEACLHFKNLATTISTLTDDMIKKYLSDIKDCERRGDDIEAMVIDQLNNTFITPFDREDIHLITINLDNALDKLNSISQKIEIYGIKKLPQNAINFANLLMEIGSELKSLVQALESKSNIDSIVKSMHLIENKGDYLFHLSIAELFNNNPDPIEVIKLKELYEELESVVDAVDYIGKIVRKILIKLG